MPRSVAHTAPTLPYKTRSKEKVAVHIAAQIARQRPRLAFETRLNRIIHDDIPNQFGADSTIGKVAKSLLCELAGGWKANQEDDAHPTRKPKEAMAHIRPPLYGFR